MKMLRAARPDAARASRLQRPFWLLAAAMLVLSCAENLPTGPTTFAAILSLLGLPDTLVIGDAPVAQARATDGNGRQVLALTFLWSVADTSIAGLGTADTASGRSRTVSARRTGRSQVTVKLPDPRFVAADISKSLTDVVGGLRISSSRDTTISAINDSGVAVAAGLARTAGVLAPRAGTGLRWVHRGVASSGAGSGDSLRYVARANGVDTLIATHDFCLAGARCADTAFIRVTQQVKLALSARAFAAWSFGDSVGPAITLVDKRGNGLAGATVRFVPATRGDSLLVAATGPIGVSNPATGQMAAPRLVAQGNGSARVKVVALGPTGLQVDIDSVTVVVRQVARRVAVDPLRAQISEVDSIPVKPNARDARGRSIADAALTAAATGVTLSGGFAHGVAKGTAYTGLLAAQLTGVALPSSNPAAPQVAISFDTAQVQVSLADSAIAGMTSRAYTVSLLGPDALPAIGTTVRFFANLGSVVPDSVKTDVAGMASATWVPPNLVGRYTFTAMVRGAVAPQTLADSSGLILLRRSVFVNPAAEDTAQSAVVMSATTIPNSTAATIVVTLRDKFGNVVTSALPTDIVISATSGAIGVVTCVQGTCTATYTAPGAAGTDTVRVKLGGVDILGSPITLTIT